MKGPIILNVLGWDYSSRWMKHNDNKNENELLNVVTGDILPVDLNSFLCKYKMKCFSLTNALSDHFLEMQTFCHNCSENWKEKIRQNTLKLSGTS